MNNWKLTSNGGVSIALCRCQQPRYEGHTNCACGQNHPEPCHRETYEDLAAHLERVQAIAADSADMIVLLLGKLAAVAEIANAGHARPRHPANPFRWVEVLALCSDPLAEKTGETNK
ncbi:MAG: hypothetical protein O3C69_04010 [Chloroflexi bacterium]|nr:hypothetical protein [Chloroflexota bacterium]